MMTERLIKRLIYRWFILDEKDTVNWRPATWPDPWRSLALYAHMLCNPTDGIEPVPGEDALHYAIMQLTGDALETDKAEHLWRDLEDAAEPLHFPTLAEIGDNLPPVGWLWPLWIPRGMLSLLGAWPGTGKSYLALDLARTTIHGGAWPDGGAIDRTGPVVYVEAEAVPSITNQRAMSLGLDRRQMYLVMAEDGKILDLTQRYWQDHLVDLVATVKPGLLVVDSLSSVNTKGQNSVEETNALLMFLVALARYGDCGMLVIHHLRKPPIGQLALPGVSIHDFRGSGHIVAMARTILGLSVMQAGKGFSLNGGARRLDHVKTNLGTYGEPLGVKLNEDGDRARFEYGPAPTWEDGDTAHETAEAWLLRHLNENGPTAVADVVAAAEEAGMSRSSVYRARKTIGDGILDSKGRQRRGNRWLLPTQQVDTDDDDSETADDD